MTRMAIIGNAGGGKSTLARALSSARWLPLYPVDRWQWRPGWEAVPEAEVAAAEAPVLAGERWIIDGFGPWPQIVARFERADAIILVDLPFWRHLWWATKRQAKAVFLGRPDGPEGCPMLPVTIRLYRMMWAIHRELPSAPHRCDRAPSREKTGLSFALRRGYRTLPRRVLLSFHPSA